MKTITPEIFAGYDPRNGQVQIAMYGAVQLGPALVATLTVAEAQKLAAAIDQAATAAERMADAARDYRTMPTTPGPTGTVDAEAAGEVQP